MSAGARPLAPPPRNRRPRSTCRTGATGGVSTIASWLFKPERPNRAGGFCWLDDTAPQTSGGGTGQEASVHYGEDGIRTVFFSPERVIRSPYEIKDGMRTEQTVAGVEISVRIYKVSDRYIAARTDQAGHANFEVIPA